MTTPSPNCFWRNIGHYFGTRIPRARQALMTLLSLSLFPLSTTAIILAEHRGGNDPVDAGWQKMGPGNDVDTMPEWVGLKPAWRIHDRSVASGSTTIYQYTPTSHETGLGSVYGWRFTGEVYLLHGGPSTVMSYDTGSRAYQLSFGHEANTRTAQVTYVGNTTRTAVNNPGFRLNTFTLESTDGTNADLLINGQPQNITSNGVSSSIRRIIWGAGTSATVGNAAFTRVRFEHFPFIEDYLVARYPLTGNAADVGPNGLGGILNAAMPVENALGQPSEAVRFQSDTSRVIIPNSSALQFTDRMTVSLWFKADSIPAGGQRRLIGKWDGGTSQLPRGVIMLTLVGGEQGQRARYEWLMGASSGQAIVVKSEEIVRYGEWNHLSIRMIMGSLALFHNGEEVATGYMSGGPLPGTSFLWGIGADGSGPNNQPDNFRGDLADVRFYRAALSDEEILGLLHDQMPRLISVDPAPGSVVPSTKGEATLVFNGPVNPASINPDKIRIRGSKSGIIGFSSVMLTNWAPQLIFSKALQPGETIQMDLSGIQGNTGAVGFSRVLTFQTEPSPEEEAYARETRGRIDSLAGIYVDSSVGAFIQQSAPMKVHSLRTMAVPLIYNSMRTQNRGAFGYGWSHPYETRLERHSDSYITVHWGPNQRSSYRLDPQSGDWSGQEDASQYDSVSLGPPTQNNRTWTIRRPNGQSYFFLHVSGDPSRLANLKNQAIETETMDGHLHSIYYGFSKQRIRFNYDPKTGLVESLHDEDPDTGKPFRHVFFEYDQQERLTVIHEPVILDHQSVGESFVPITMTDGPQGLTIRTLRVNEGETVGFLTLDLCFISHPRVSDLTVTLVSPKGTAAVLHDRESGFPNLDFSGLRLADFNGEDPKGDWQLRIIDHVPGVVGTLNGFTFMFSESSNPIHYSYTPAPVSAAGMTRIRQARDMKGQQLFSVTYNAQGRVATQNDGLATNRVATFSYRNLPGNQQESIYHDRLGHPHTFVHDSRGYLLSLKNPLGHETVFEYDSRGNRVAFGDALGRITRFTYNERGFMTSATEPVPGNPVMTFEYSSFDPYPKVTRLRDALGQQTRFEYASNNNLRRVIDHLNNSDTKSYGGASQMVDNLLAGGGGVGFKYANGQLSGAAHMQLTGIKADLSYDPAGRALILTDPKGNQSRVGYYPNGAIRAKIDALGQSEVTLLDHRSRVFRIIDRRGHSTYFAYDNNNNLVSVINAAGQETRYTYDGEDRQIRIIAPGNRITDFTYDAAGRMLSQTNPMGQGQYFVYDAVGNMTEVYDSRMNLLRRATYNERNQPVRMEDGIGNVAELEYDILGRQTGLIDPQGGETRLSYDHLDRLVELTDPLGRSFRQEFSSDDLLQRMYYPNGRSIRFTYDRANRLTGFETPNSSYTTRYDERDLVTHEYTNGLGPQALFKYDALGRMIEKSYTGTAQNPIYGYAYDASNNLLQVGTKGSSGGALTPRITREYDEINRPVTYRDDRGNTIRYTYTESSDLRQLVYPDGRIVNYAYNAAGQVTQITDWAGRETHITYNTNGLITVMDFPNGTFRMMAYDANNKLTERADYTASGQVIVRYIYSYDGDGRVRSERTDHSVEPYQPSRVEMTYDERNRLSTFNGLPTTFDRAGKMLTGPLSGGQATFSYDERDNLAQVHNFSYRYDLEDNLTGFIENGQVTDLVVNPAPGLSQILTKTTPQGTRTTYVWGIGLAYEETPLGGIRVYHYDMRGSTVALTGSNGEVEATLVYGPFGERVRSLGVVDTPFTLNGLYGVITSPQNLSWMRYRWYHPEIRRFITEDMHFGDIQNPASLNRYAFAGNNPISNIDPQGEAFWILIGAAVGAVVNVAIELTIDILDDGQINTPVEDYLAAAIGGAVTGAIITACPACGASSGALGAGAAALAGALMKGESLTEPEFLVGLGVDMAVGAAFGKLGSGKGGLSRTKSSQATEIAQVMTPGGRLPLMVPKRTIATVASPGGALPIPIPPRLKEKVGGQFTNAGKNFAKDYLAGLTQDYIGEGLKGLAVNAVEAHIPAAAGPQPGQMRASNAGGNIEVHRRATRALNEGNKGVYGEFAHWFEYVRFLQMADQPVLVETAQQLSTF